MLDEKRYPTPERVKEELAKHLEEEEKKDPEFWKKFDDRNAKENMPKGDEENK